MAKKTKSRKTNADYYAEIQQSIMAMLNQNELPPWRKPWKAAPGTFEPMNLSSGKAYRGINVWLLLMAQHSKGYSNNCWLTYKQAAELAAKQARKAGRTIEETARTSKRGHKKTTFVDAETGERPGGVKKGEKATTVYLWKPVKKTEKDEQTGDENKRQYLLMRSYKVFNVDQCEGITLPSPDEQPAFEPLHEAQAIADGYFDRPGAPSLVHGGGRACYSPMLDKVYMPAPESFSKQESYYGVLFHEAAHSTGHKSRLDRDLTCLAATHSYAEEELVAEFASCFLCGRAGIEQPMLENSAAYIRGWREKLVNSDPAIVVLAAQRAQKAADLILGETMEHAKDKSEAA